MTREKANSRRIDLSPRKSRIIVLASKSYPATCRFSGEPFQKGPLASQCIENGYQYFDKEGKVRTRYKYLIPPAQHSQHKSPQEFLRRSTRVGPYVPTPLLPLPYQDPLASPSLPVAEQTTVLPHAPVSEETLVPLPKTLPRVGTTRAFHTITQNIYNHHDFRNTQRPSHDLKSQPWPRNPTSIPKDEAQCDQCTQSACDCIDSILLHKIVPTIAQAGDKGEGAFVPRPFTASSDIVYAKGDLIGELVGRLVPVMSSRSPQDWYMALIRSDLPKRPILAYIDCEVAGNWVRKINHHCTDFNTTFQGLRISGKYRVMVHAKRDLYASEEILAHYQKEFWDGEGRRCTCGSNACVSRISKA